MTHDLVDGSCILAGLILVCGILFVLAEKPFSWSLRTRCRVTGKMFFCYYSRLPCPCHGEKKEGVISRWRLGGWQVKEDEKDQDSELAEIRRMCGLGKDVKK